MSIAAPAPVAAQETSTQPFLVRRAAVLGAGTMGSRIAAHLANAGIPSFLLDLVPDGAGAQRNKLAMKALDALGKSKPAAFYEPGLAALITPGNFEDDLAKLGQCDWVIEAVAENLEIKRALLERVVPHLAPRAVLTTNTSGLPVKQIAAGFGQASGAIQKRFFGAHFFNPPRYMKLLEIIPAPGSDPAVVAAFAAFADRQLGKQVVFANDTPNFIANRIGVAVTFTAATLMLDQGLTIEEADALTGPAIGWPRTGTFRLADMVGIDVLAHVAANFPQGAAQGSFSAVLQEIVKRGWLGDKTGQGFYKKIRGAAGKEERFVLDVKTFEYRPLAKAALPSLDMAKNAPTLKERLKLLLANDPAKDKSARFLWPLLSTLWNFSADRIGEAANDVPSIDRATRAGFNWEMGPFEMWDAVGVSETISRMKSLSIPVSPNAEALLAAGRDSWYASDSDAGRECFQPLTGQMEPLPQVPGHARVADFRRSNGVVRGNSGASLVDLGDGIGCIELHSLKNAIGGDVVSVISSVLQPGSDAVRDFAGFVISGDRDNFSVGANLLQLLLSAQEGEWDEIAAAIRAFQQMTAAIKFCPRPVVVAPFGMTLGGGAEICLHATRRQPYAETYIGLVEAGVGLIPGGGGTKEMLLRAVDAAAAVAAARPQRPSFALCPVGGDAGRASAHARNHCHGQGRHVGRRGARPRPRGSFRPHHPQPRTAAAGRQSPGCGAGRGGVRRSAASYPDSRPGPGGIRGARNRHLPHGRSGLRLRARPEGGALGGLHPGRRPGDGRIPGERAVPAGPRTRGFPFSLRRAQDPGADRVHAQDGQATAELSAGA